MSPELQHAADAATDTAKAAAWEKLQAAVGRWWVCNRNDPAEMRRWADACCEYAGKRVERHVAAEREACAQMLEKYADVADMAGGLASPKQHRLWEAARAVRARSGTVDVLPPEESAAYLTWLEHGTPDDVAAREREACAQLVLDCGIVDDLELRRIADAIRARGNAPARLRKNTGCLECNEPDCPACHPGPVDSTTHAAASPSQSTATATPSEASPLKPLETSTTPDRGWYSVAEVNNLVREHESLKRQLEKWRRGELTRLADGRITAESSSWWREKYEALHASLEATVPKGSTWSPLTQAARLLRERDEARAEVKRLRETADARFGARVVTERNDALAQRDGLRDALRQVKDALTRLKSNVAAIYTINHALETYGGGE